MGIRRPKSMSDQFKTIAVIWIVGVLPCIYLAAGIVYVINLVNGS
jgi:hypothetical protein